MLNLIWLALLLIGVFVGGITGQLPAINQGVLNAAKSAVMDVALPLSGAMTLWLGMMRLAEKAGLVRQFARLIRPILIRLFSDVPPDHPAMGSMVMNMAANMLGVSNAATPLGLRAMSQLNELNTKLNALRQRILSMTSGVVAFSGGVDSSFVLKVAHELLSERVIGVTAPVMRDLAGAAALIARAEGLTAHARALEIRLEGR